MDINDLLKEYGFEPLQRIPRNLKNLVNAAYEPIYQNNFARSNLNFMILDIIAY